HNHSHINNNFTELHFNGHSSSNYEYDSIGYHSDEYSSYSSNSDRRRCRSSSSSYSSSSCSSYSSNGDARFNINNNDSNNINFNYSSLSPHIIIEGDRRSLITHSLSSSSSILSF